MALNLLVGCLMLPTVSPVLGLWTNSLKGVYRQEMDNTHDLQYNANVTVGGQLLQVVLDTGSIELVVLSQRCHLWCGEESRLYNPKISDNYFKGAYSLVLNYGSGQLLGHEAYDTFQVGPFTGINASFWEVVDANMPLLFNSKFEAILGMGPIPKGARSMHPGATTNVRAFALGLDSLGLRESRYSVCLGQAPGSAGWVTWNDNIATTMPQAFTKLDIVDTGYWMVRLEDIRMGNVTIGCTDGCGAILDSGTSLLALPSTMQERMEGLVVSDGGCAQMQELPDLNFKMDGIEYSLPPDAYLGNVQGEASKAFEKALGIRSNGTKMHTESAKCKVSVMQISMTSSLGETLILGMPFFRTYYTTFAQGAGNTSPHILTAQADQNCYPMANGGNGSSLHTTRRSVTARSIDVAKVQIPPWLQKASATGRLEETQGRPSGSELYVSSVVGPHGVLEGLDEVIAD